MAIFSFDKTAGIELTDNPGVLEFGTGEHAFEVPSPTGVTPAGLALRFHHYLARLPLEAGQLRVEADPEASFITVHGVAANQAVREKIVLACGNVRGVQIVHDEMDCTAPGPSSAFHTVRTGETMASIAEQYFGSVAYATLILEANRPMLGPMLAFAPGLMVRIPRARDPDSKLVPPSLLSQLRQSFLL